MACRNYFKLNYKENRGLSHVGTLSLEKEFPASISQTRRIYRNLGFYSIIILSYVVNPLSEEQGFANTIRGLKEVETMCNSRGRVLIVQDRFSESVVKRITGLLGKSYQEDTLTQYMYSSRNNNDSYTYRYYYCLFVPNNYSSDLAAVSA
jgi:hypothetical protein